jgi:hypothetical protein
VKGEKDQDNNVKNRLSVQAQGPVRLFVLGKKKKACEYFYADKNNEGYAADSVKQPYEHKFDRYQQELSLSSYLYAFTGISWPGKSAENMWTFLLDKDQTMGYLFRE